jgi:hypothetical protein
MILAGRPEQQVQVYPVSQQVEITVVVGRAELQVEAKVPATHPLDLPVELGIEGLLVSAPVR